MKTLVHLFVLHLLGLATVFAHPSTRMTGEWLVPSLKTSKAFALVDASTGTVRVAGIGAGPSVKWSAPVPTGIDDVSDVTAGLLDGGEEILALTSPAANRVVLMDFLSSAPYPRVVQEQSGFGPSGLGPVGGPFSRDLLVASASNGTTPGRLNTHTDLADDADLIAASGHATPFRRIQPLTDPSGDPTIGLISGTSGVNTRMELADRSGGIHSLAFKATFTNTVEFATNVRSDYGPGRLFTIGYRVDDNAAQLIQFSTPLTTASSYASDLVKLPFAVSTVVPILDGGAGDMTDGFIAIAADGSQAAHIRINADLDGIEPAARTFSAEPGTFLNGIVPAAGIGLVKLNAGDLGGPTTSYNAYQWNGSDWVETDSGTLPQIPAAGEIPATLLFYNSNPIDDESARLLGVRHVASWTRRTSGDPVPASVLAESFVSSSQGLTAAGNEAVNPPVGTNYVMTTQFEPGISIAAATGVGGLMAPDLRVDPPSGTYEESFQVAAEYDESIFDLRYRRDGGDWEAFPESLPVAWSTTLQFMLRSATGGPPGRIVTREYNLPASSLGDLDSDNDGVPDYVEQYLGLDPFGGPDADADGVSDLDEILQGTNPLDPTETPSPNETANISPGGTSIVASALDAEGIEIAKLQDLEARAIDGSLLARAPVDDISPSLPDGGDRGAVLRSSDTQPFDSLVAIHTPLYFDVTTGDRSGREIIGFVRADPPPSFDPGFTPSGSDLTADATGWISAAQSAAANHPLAEARRVVDPSDAAVAVLVEGITHAALAGVRPPGDPLQPIDQFSFLPGRDRDRSRYFPTSADRALLRAAGYDFRSALGFADSSGRFAMTPAAEDIYRHHAANSESTPGIPLPIDALRTALRSGSLPPDYSGAVSAGDLAAARNAYAITLLELEVAFRPIESWTVEILATPPEPGVYQRESDSAEVVLLDASGDRFSWSAASACSRAAASVSPASATPRPPVRIRPSKSRPLPWPPSPPPPTTTRMPTCSTTNGRNSSSVPPGRIRIPNPMAAATRCCSISSTEPTRVAASCRAVRWPLSARSSPSSPRTVAATLWISFSPRNIRIKSPSFSNARRHLPPVPGSRSPASPSRRSAGTNSASPSRPPPSPPATPSTACASPSIDISRRQSVPSQEYGFWQTPRAGPKFRGNGSWQRVSD